MTMKRVVRCLFFASGVLMVPALASPQQPSGGRRVELEYLDRGFDLEGITTPEHRPEFWNTPEGRAVYEQLRLERFQQSVEELSQLEKHDWVARYDAVSDRRVREELERRAKELEKVTDDMIKFLEWRFQVEPLEVDGLTEASVRERLMQITPMVEQILETIATLTGGGIPVQEFVEMRGNLAQIHALSRSLRD